MTNTINDATKVYQNALEKISEQSSDNQPVGASFGDILKDSLTTAVDTQYKSEQMSAAAVTGQANMTDVIQAVTDAEMTLNTVLAVRDRVISAYQEIMRMPV